MSKKPKANPASAAQALFVRHALAAVDHWNNAPDLSQHERLYGLTVSLLGALDGKVPGLPGCAVIPITDGEPQDIGGNLHRHFVVMAEKLGKTPEVSTAHLPSEVQAAVQQIGAAFDAIPTRNTNGAKPV